MKLILPTSYTFGKTRVLLSLNQFMAPLGSTGKKGQQYGSRSFFYQQKAKTALMKEVREIADARLAPVQNYPVELVITITRDSDRATDIGNYCIVEKFTTDALVQAGILKDDNWKYISKVTYIDGGKDPMDPHATYEIVEPTKPKRPREE